jgi:hypothetical protein
VISITAAKGLALNVKLQSRQSRPDVGTSGGVSKSFGFID